MSIRFITAFAVAATLLSGCASINIPDMDFMGGSDFNDEIAEMEMGFPSPDEAPDIPADVRSAAEWDDSAREMQELHNIVDVPDLEPALSPEVFDRQFETAKDEATAYRDDDPS